MNLKQKWSRFTDKLFKSFCSSKLFKTHSKDNGTKLFQLHFCSDCKRTRIEHFNFVFCEKNVETILF